MSTSKQPLVWLITGTSTGLGRELALAALARGEKVIATARSRSINKLDDLKTQGAQLVELDVTSSLEQLKEIANKAVGIYGHVDVLVNNAGFIEVGALEENTPEETLDQFNTNVFGALNVARAFLPHMRKRKSGTIVWLGSLGGWTVTPAAGLYCTTKYAVRSLSQTLDVEISPLGLRSIVFEFGYFRTSFLTPDHRSAHKGRIEDYREMSESTNAALEAYNGKQPGDPSKGVQLMLDVIRGEGLAQGKELPAVLALGSDCVEAVKEVCRETIKRVEEWESISRSTDF